MPGTALKVLHVLSFLKLVIASVRVEPEVPQLRSARPRTSALLSMAKQGPAGKESWLGPRNPSHPSVGCALSRPVWVWNPPEIILFQDPRV